MTIAELLAIVADPETPEQRDEAWNAIVEQVETLERDLADTIKILTQQRDEAQKDALYIKEQFGVLEAALQKIADNCEVVDGADGHPSIVYGGIDFRAVAAEALAAVRNPASSPVPDWSPGDVIAADEDGTITLDDGITTWNPTRAAEFLAKSNKTPAELLDDYEQAAREMPWHLRWWYLRKARKARREWDERRDGQLARVIREEQNQDSGRAGAVVGDTPNAPCLTDQARPEHNTAMRPE